MNYGQPYRYGFFSLRKEHGNSLDLIWHRPPSLWYGTERSVDIGIVASAAIENGYDPNDCRRQSDQPEWFPKIPHAACFLDRQGIRIMSVQMVGNVVLFIVIVALEFTVILFPIAKILRRMGLSGWWSLLYLTGIGVIIGPWILAYCRWPAFDRGNNSTEALPERGSD